MIFVDTGARYSTFVAPNPKHLAAQAWFQRNRLPLLTSDYVVDETLMLLKARGETGRALVVAEEFFRGDLATIHFLNEQEIRAAFEIFRKFADKEWSLTDCASKVAMESLGLTTAFAFDHHFRQIGGIHVVPSTL